MQYNFVASHCAASCTQLCKTALWRDLLPSILLDILRIRADLANMKLWFKDVYKNSCTATSSNTSRTPRSRTTSKTALGLSAFACSCCVQDKVWAR